MKAYKSFDHWYKAQTPAKKNLIRPLRALVNASSKKLEESVKWGNGVWIYNEWPVIYIYVDRDHVQFGFFGGSYLKDAKKVLEGNGKYIRFIRIYTKADIPKTKLTKMVKEAIKNLS